MKKVNISISGVDNELLKNIKKLCIDKGITLKKFFVDAISEKFKKESAKTKKSST